MASDLAALYKNSPRVLWVEDEETKAYLSIVWEAKRFSYLIAGGVANVRAVVEDAKKEKHRHVFGIVDRDFGSTNRDKWQTPGDDLRIYKLESHELENLLLNEQAIEASEENDCSRTAQQITQRLQSLANNMVWWMATRHLITHINRSAMDGFPQHPRITDVTDLATATNFILQTPWFGHAVQQITTLTSQTYVTQQLQQQSQHYTAALNNGNWRHEFSGKELFRSIRGYIFSGKNSAAPVDLIKSVARWQIENQSIPDEISELGEAIENRPL